VRRPRGVAAIWRNQPEWRAIALILSVFGRLDLAGTPPWECRLGESPVVGRDNVDSRPHGLRRSEASPARCPSRADPVYFS